MRPLIRVHLCRQVEAVHPHRVHYGGDHDGHLLGAANGTALPTLPYVPPYFLLNEATHPLTLGVLVMGQYNGGQPSLPVTGYLPQGLPVFAVPTVPAAHLGEIITGGLLCVAIGYMESYSLALKMASKHKYRVDPDQEMMALGAANAVGAFFQSYPVTGSFSRYEAPCRDHEITCVRIHAAPRSASRSSSSLSLSVHARPCVCMCIYNTYIVYVCVHTCCSAF